MASVDEPVNLQLDAVAGLGQEPVPAVLMFVQFQRFDLTVAETWSRVQLAGIQSDVAHCENKRKKMKKMMAEEDLRVAKRP